jgi:molybdopterin synthase catalytic subunit/molybdopterin converting factor small subunit
MAESNKVHVKFFAIFREYVGLKEDWAEIEPGTSVQDLWFKYAATAKNPRVANIRAAYSVNQRLAKPETLLHGGEEVGFLPPVSGGQERKKYARSRKNFFVTERQLNLGALIKKVEHPSSGAITTFTGVVRDNAHEHEVKFLEYEAYAELAEKTLRQIGDEVRTRWSEVRLAMAHRSGHLDIGEASVMIAASAPHRAEAFAACRYAIERIKHIMPVWKKEFASNDEYWVEGPVADELTPEQAEAVVRRAEDYENNPPSPRM